MLLAIFYLTSLATVVAPNFIYEKRAELTRYDRKTFLDNRVPEGGYAKQMTGVSLTECALECRVITCKAFFYTDDKLDTCQICSHLTGVKYKASNGTIGFMKDYFVPGLSAWQTSTFVDSMNRSLSADLAIDKNFDNTDDINGLCYQCARTNSYNSFWAMEFSRVTEVEHVVIYFRNPNGNSGNRNLRLLISETRFESDNDIGKECAFYTGPPVSPAKPVNIVCDHSVRGKFLKISQQYSAYLTLCEVEVYST